jgi:hypothetical protein
MSAKRKTKPTGLTLIEIVVAMTVLLVGILGAMGYRYYSILDARKAKVYITAARLGSTLLENWKGTGGRAKPGDEFDPQDTALGSHLMVYGPGSVGPSVPASFKEFGKYTVIVDGATYYTTLSCQDDDVVKLRVLNVVVGWPYKYPSGNFYAADEHAAGQSVRFSTKVLVPAE